MVFSFIDKVIVEMKLSLNYKCVTKKKRVRERDEKNEVKLGITYWRREQLQFF